MTKTDCIDCDPYPENKYHLIEHVDRIGYFLETPFRFLGRVLGLSAPVPTVLKNAAEDIVFSLLVGAGILKETPLLLSDTDIHNRTLVLIPEAEKRGITIKALRMFGRATNFFSIVHDHQKAFFEGLPHVQIGNQGVEIDDKGALKALLKSVHAPYPDGRICTTLKEARRAATEIGYPLAVKPRFGSLSRHTTWGISHDEALYTAVRNALRISPEFVLEKHIPGAVYRITLVGGACVAACMREAAHVVGDGTHTISALIDRKNKNQHRIPVKQKNATLHTLPVGVKTQELLKAQGYTLQSIPQSGEKIRLHDKVVLAAGADIHDVTDNMHPDTVRMFERVARLSDSGLVGIDFIAEDISRPYTAQQTGVIEVNLIPYIDMHHYPTSGAPRNVAGSLLDWYISSRRSRTSVAPF